MQIHLENTFTTGKAWSGDRFNGPTPPAEDYIPPSVSESSSIKSSEEAPPPPTLYFDVDKAKEDKYTNYAELRKKHRERWTPPNMSSSGPSRSEQVCKVFSVCCCFFLRFAFLFSYICIKRSFTQAVFYVILAANYLSLRNYKRECDVRGKRDTSSV